MWCSPYILRESVGRRGVRRMLAGKVNWREKIYGEGAAAGGR